MTSSNTISIEYEDHEGVMFRVPSSTTNEKYLVNVFFDDRGWYCGCDGWYYHHKPCKHIKQCQALLDMEGEES